MIKINNQEIPVYPSEYDDDPVIVKKDSFAIDGSIERHQFPSKKRVKMEFTALTVSQNQYFKQLFEANQTVDFYNNQSVYGELAFTGVILSTKSSSYYRGGSLLTNMSVTIREV